jgi:hypothetical protein
LSCTNGTSNVISGSVSGGYIPLQLTNTGTGDCRLNLYCQNATPGSATISFRTGTTPTERFAIYTGASGLATGSFGLYNGGSNNTPFSMDYTTGQLYLGATTQTTISSAGKVTIANTDQSTSSSTGALILSGGLGIAKNLWQAASMNAALSYLTHTVTEHINLTDADTTYVATAISPYGMLVRTGMTTNRTDTLPTPSALVSQYGKGFLLLCHNQTTTYTWTLNSSVGMTMYRSGSTSSVSGKTISSGQMAILWFNSDCSIVYVNG